MKNTLKTLQTTYNKATEGGYTITSGGHDTDIGYTPFYGYYISCAKGDNYFLGRTVDEATLRLADFI